MDYLYIFVMVVLSASIPLIIRWFNPPLKPPEDEWKKWNDLTK